MIKDIIIGILSIVVISGICYIEFLKIKRNELMTEKRSLEVQLSISEGNVKQLGNAIDIQNSAIKKIKNDADEKQIRDQKELQKAKKVADYYKGRADDILKSVPSNPENMCLSAEDLINQEIIANGK